MPDLAITVAELQRLTLLLDPVIAELRQKQELAEAARVYALQVIILDALRTYHSLEEAAFIKRAFAGLKNL